MLEMILLIGGPGILLFIVELVIIRLTRRRFRPLRFLSLLTLLIPLALAAEAWLTKSGWFWELGVLLYLIMAGLMLFGWGLAYGEEYARSWAEKSREG